MAVNLSPIFNATTNFNATGGVLSGGLLYTYQAGTITPLATFSDALGLITNPNPIVLGVDGRSPVQIWLTQGSAYKFVLQDANGITQFTEDNIAGAVTSLPAVQVLPSGIIVAWSGQIGSIPGGWQLCDGTNGTPDLRDKFILAAGLTYPVNAQGGYKDTVLVQHTHTAVTSLTDPGHTHMSQGNGAPNGAGAGSAFTDPGNQPGRTTQIGYTGMSAATTISTVGVSGVGMNIPPFFALAYIQKM